MTNSAPKQRSDTAEQILDLAETLIQTCGYSAFSYQDIADSLGIRKSRHPLSFPLEDRSGDRGRRVDHFFKTHQMWLTKILKRGGGARGEFRLPAPAPKVARFVLGALQGALLVKRTTDDPSQLNDVIAVMKLQLAARR
jgi:hypothetical protein